MKNILITLINFYQGYLSFDHGLLAIFTPGGVCKYEQTCSQYTKQMVMKHGAVQGMNLGIKRIWSCK